MKDLVTSTVTAVSTKVRDNNKIHIGGYETVEKMIAIDRVHKRVFHEAYGKSFDRSESTFDGKDKVFALRSLDRVNSIIGVPAVKVLGTGDMCLVAPWAMLTQGIDTGETADFGPGKLVLPITKGPIATVCFLPCGGMDYETDELPTWAVRVNMSTLYPSFDVKLHKACWTEGRGKMTTEKKTNHVHLFPGQVEVGDFLLINNEAKEVYTVGENANFPEGKAELATFRTNWDGSVLKPRNFKIGKMPYVYGAVRAIPNNYLLEKQAVSMSLAKVADDNTGTLKLSFMSARFNGCGFLVHETHVVE